MCKYLYTLLITLIIFFNSFVQQLQDDLTMSFKL